MNDNMCWGEFQRAFYNSILSITQSYMFLPRLAAETVYRERLYCYELYHQLRNHLPEDFPYLLHGEIDKRGQQFFRDALGYFPNPDFVLHIPQTMNNLIVVEVKNSVCPIQEAEEDIEKLSNLISNPEIHYQHGIFLVFGPHNQRERLVHLEINNQHITYFWHHTPGEIPELLAKGDWDI